MKVDFNDYGSSVINITLMHETIKEVASLLRYAKNANSEKAEVYFSFRNEPYCSISLSKRSPKVQKSFINPNLK